MIIRHFFLQLFLLLTLTFVIKAQNKTDNFFENLKPYKGYFNFYYDTKKDKVYLEIENFNDAFLYMNSMSSGVGNNDLGLDRGQLGKRRVVYFKRAGDRVLMIEPNLKYRAQTDNILEKKSINEAFAKSVLFAFPIKKEIKNKVYVDISTMIFDDTHGVEKRLKALKTGVFKVDKNRSAIFLERTKAFPKNIEFDVLLTLQGDPKGSALRNVVPTPEALTVHLHHSFIELPKKPFPMRKFDPRSGAIPFTFYDYATPVEENTLQRYIIRHRLEKKDPNEEISAPVSPIIYYLDNGTPEPVRSALLEGGKWWNEAFESIGYKNAFQIKILPDNVDPLDIRYNVIQWVHRSTRGWSYGASVVDPRTGEILKGHVSLGSLRIRQDFMIAQGLTNNPYEVNDNNHKKMLSLALARIRQLSAHEIGHTLGFAHNFAASASNRASVMDYPHPLLKIKDAEIDYSDAYAIGIGDWDKTSVAYSYSHFPQGVDELKALNSILETSQKKDIQFITDKDARPRGGAHPYAHLWDNGKNPVNELLHLLEVRQIVFRNFGKNQLQSQQPYSVLEDMFVPQYFLHRYQIEAVAKWIAGVNYNYSLKNDGQLISNSLDYEKQTKALEALITTLHPKHLSIPKNILKMFPPRAFGYPKSRESFASQTGVVFDGLSTANTLSDKIISLIFNPQRASRLVQQNGLDETQLSLEETIDLVFENTFYNNFSNGYESILGQIVCYNVLKHLKHLGLSKNTYPQVKAIVNGKLMELKDGLQKQLKKKNTSKQITYFWKEYNREIERYFKYPQEVEIWAAPKIPDGSPIGISCY